MHVAPLVTAVAVGFDTLRANPLRTILSTLGVIIGVSALVAVLSVGDGMERSVRAQIEGTTDLQAITITARTHEEVDGQNFPLANPVRLSAADAQRIRALEGVKAVTLVTAGAGEVRNGSGTSRRMSMIIAEFALRDSATMKVAAGRLLTAHETAGHLPVVVLSSDLARALSSDSSAASIIGDSVQLGGARAEVVGVLEAQSGQRAILFAGRGRAQGDYRVYAPLDLASAAITMRVQPPGIMVLSSTVERTTELKQRMEQSLAAQDTAWQKHYAVTTNEARLEQISRGILMFKLFMGAITGISLLVGGIGIMNVLLSSVTERTREIGIRKATGARDNDILHQFLAESVAISAVGSGIGLALGLAGAYGITAGIRRFSQAPFLSASVSWSTLVVAALAAILIGLTFGTYPARRAARLSPIDAIRHE